MAEQSEATLKYGTAGIAELLRDLDQVKRALKAVEQSATDANRVDAPGAGKQTAQAAGYAKTIGGVASALQAAAVPAAAFFGTVAAGSSMLAATAIREAAGLEQQIDKVAAVMQGGASVRGLLEQAAIEAGAKSAYSARQAGEALEFMAMAGMSARDAIAGVGPVLSLAASGSTDLARSADILTNIMTGYGKTAADLAAVNDVLVGTFTRSNVNLEQLGEAFKYVAPIARASGQEFELMSAAIGRLGDAGIQGSQAGTTLRQALIRLQDPPKRARQALQELGVETKDASGQLLQLDQILAQLSTRGASVGQVARIFGVESSAGMAALIAQGPERLREFADQLKLVQGLAAQIERAKLDNLNGQLEIARGGAETLAASLGRVLLPELTETVKVTNDYLQSGQALVGVQRELARAADEQQGALSTLARDALAVADASANGLAANLRQVLGVVTALLSPLDSLKRLTGLGSIEIESAGERAEGLARKLGLVSLALGGALMFFPPVGAALVATGIGLGRVAEEAGKTAQAIQDATDKRRIEESRAAQLVLRDTGLLVWGQLTNAVNAYAASARDALAGQGLGFLSSLAGQLTTLGKTQGQLTAEAVERAAAEEAAREALDERLKLGRFDLQLAQAATPLERERITFAREKYRLDGLLSAGTIKAVEYEQQLAIARASYAKASADVAKERAKERAELAQRVQLAGFDLALVSAADDRERARLTAARARAVVEADLVAKKIVQAEADARLAQIDQAERKALEDSARARAASVAATAKRVELARYDLALAVQTDERERARLAAARQLAELEQGPTGGVADEEERAAKRAQIARQLADQLKAIEREQAERRKADLDKALAESSKAGDYLTAAMSSLGEDPWSRQVKGLAQMGGAVMTLTQQLDALATAEAGAGEAMVVAMRTAGPAVAAALGQMGASQRLLSGVKAAFYAAEAVGQASVGNVPGAISAGIAAAMHAAVAAGAGGGGGGGGAGGAVAAGREAGRAPEGSFLAPAVEPQQRQLARFIGEELSRGRAGGDVVVNVDLRGSTTLEQSPELARRLTGVLKDELGREGLDVERLR